MSYIRLGIPKNPSEGLAAIKVEDRFRHLLCCAATGRGKTTFFLNLIKKTDGAMVIIDPAGGLAEAAHAFYPNAKYITKQNHAICLNPLTRDYLNNSEISNELTEVINTAVKATSPQQVEMTVLMNRIVRNALRVGLKDLKKLSDFLDFESYREKVKDRYWKDFDAKDHKGWYINREMRESAKRISSRLSFLVDDINLFPMLRGQYDFHLDQAAKNKDVFIFNLKGYDSFIISFIGALVLNYVRSYYQHVATEESPPLYVYVDEIHQFMPESEGYERLLKEGRKYNISFNVSFYSFKDLSQRLASMLWTNCLVKAYLGGSRVDTDAIGNELDYDMPKLGKYEGVIGIEYDPHHVRMYAPPEAPEVTLPKLNFMRPGWVNY